LRGLYSEGLIYGGKFAFQIDWASLIVGRKFTVFALFYFVFEGNFQVQAPRGAYIWRGHLTEAFLRYEFGGLIFGGAYTWRGLFSEFYGIRIKRLEFKENVRAFFAQGQSKLSVSVKRSLTVFICLFIFSII